MKPLRTSFEERFQDALKQLQSHYNNGLQRETPLIENSSKLEAPSKQREGLNLVLVSTTVMKWKHINVELIHEWRELLI